MSKLQLEMLQKESPQEMRVKPHNVSQGMESDQFADEETQVVC